MAYNYQTFTIICLFVCSGTGRGNDAQIKAMASKPEFSLIKPSVNELQSLSDKVMNYTCEDKYSLLLVFSAVLLKDNSTST